MERWFWQGRLVLSSCHCTLRETAHSLTPQTHSSLSLSLSLFPFFFLLFFSFCHAHEHKQGNSWHANKQTHSRALTPTTRMNAYTPRRCGNEGTSLQTLTLPARSQALSWSRNYRISVIWLRLFFFFFCYFQSFFSSEKICMLNVTHTPSSTCLFPLTRACNYRL